MLAIRFKNFVKYLILTKLVSRDSLMLTLYEVRTLFLSKSISAPQAKINRTNQQNDQVLQIKCGVFAGCYFETPKTNVSLVEIAQRLYGVYEQQILNLFENRSWENAIIFGGSDGYYGVGGLSKNNFESVIIYEISPILQKQIHRNMMLNNITENRYKICGRASASNVLSQLQSYTNTFNKNLLLCDIEGDEYNLFTQDLLRALANCNFDLIIELHDTTSYISENFHSLLHEFYSVSILNPFIRDTWNLEGHLNVYESKLISAEPRGDNFSFIFCIPKNR